MEDIYQMKKFESFFDEILKNVWETASLSNQFARVTARMNESVAYNVPHRTKIRGYLVPVVYQCLVDTSKITTDQDHLSCIMGWCLQIFQAAMTMIDDSTDDDAYRFGKATWWQHNQKRRCVATDIVLLKHTVFRLIFKFCGQTVLSTKLVNYFNEVCINFLLGQSLSYKLRSKNDPNMDGFNMMKWKICAKYTNKQYIFVSPFKTASILASEIVPKRSMLLTWNGKPNLDLILEKIMLFWATADDIADSFAVDSVNPLRHQDILLGSCTLLIIKAKEIAMKKKWEELVSCYGKNNPELVKRVLGIFKELRVVENCNQYMNMLHADVKKDIKEMTVVEPMIGKVLAYFLKCFERLRE